MIKTKSQVDMTQGNIIHLIVQFALPICISNILQQLYNTVDTLIIGNSCGSLSLAAIGTSSQPVEMLLCLFLGFGTGVSILISQSIGKHDTAKLQSLAANAVTLLFLCAAVFSAAGLLLSPLMLSIMQVPEETRSLANSYITIIFLGSICNMGYNMNAGILRGLGDSRSSIIFLLISCFVNIVLDFVFVVFLQMNIAGAAIATVIAMLCSWLFSIFYIKKRYPYLNFTFLPRSFDKEIIRRMLAVGVPLGLNNSIYSIGHIFLQAFINLQGAGFMAACSVATKITGIANVAITSFSASATTFSGQNLGAGNFARLKKGSLLIPFSSGIITFSAGIVFTIFCRPVIGLFTSDPEVIRFAVRYINIVLPLTWMYAVLSSTISYVNGIGEVRYPTICNILMLWAVRIPCAYLIMNLFEGTYLMACYPVSFGFGMIMMLLYFRTKKWKNLVNRIKKEPAP